MVYLWTFINDHQLLRRWLGAFSQLVIVIFLCISQQPLSGIDLVAMSYLIWSTIMTSSINKINKQGESTSVLINQQPQSYYAREDIAPVNASYANGYILLALCFMATAFGIWLMCTSVPCIRTRIRITNRLTTSLRILWSRCLVSKICLVDFHHDASIDCGKSLI
ncbi:unnamed protein product [Rotaria socialis]